MMAGYSLLLNTNMDQFIVSLHFINIKIWLYMVNVLRYMLNKFRYFIKKYPLDDYLEQL